MQEKLYEPLGMRYLGYWLVDSKGVEHAYAGLNLTAQDYAKIGELFRNGGKWDGKQIISSEWVHDATNYDSPMRAPGSPVIGSHTVPFGYGYQWWVPDGTEGEFTGVGVYNQFVYVNAKRKVTIVKLSANHNYGLSEGEEHNREYESLCYMRAIAGKF
jgi:CubicO group peptidase (beta-lactamase class C family)